MWIERKVLAAELPAAAGLETRPLCEMLAALGFPVDGVATRAAPGRSLSGARNGSP